MRHLPAFKLESNAYTQGLCKPARAYVCPDTTASCLCPCVPTEESLGSRGVLLQLWFPALQGASLAFCVVCAPDVLHAPSA